MQCNHLTTTRCDRIFNDDFRMIQSTPDFVLIQHKDFKVIFPSLPLNSSSDSIISLMKSYSKVTTFCLLDLRLNLFFVRCCRPRFTLTYLKFSLPCLVFILSGFFFQFFLLSFIASVIWAELIVRTFGPFVHFKLATESFIILMLPWHFLVIFVWFFVLFLPLLLHCDMSFSSIISVFASMYQLQSWMILMASLS